MQLPLSKNVINDKYGRKIGLLVLLRSRIQQRLGAYRSYQNIAWEQVRRLVFICHGNICRSAYAQARAHQLGLPTASAGLGADKDGPADPQATKIAATRNIDLTTHTTTRIADLQRQTGDLFLCMEPAQALALREIVGTDTHQQVTLLGLWSQEQRPYLQDPYGLKDTYWHTCFDIIDSAVQQVQAKVPDIERNRLDETH